MATLQDFKNNVKPNWCPGCGDYAVQMALQKAAVQLGMKPYELALVCGIGCSGRLSGYIYAYGMHTTHGRALPFAQGLKIANPELNVIACGGDGDGMAIGMGHTFHELCTGCRKCVDFCAFNALAYIGGKVKIFDEVCHSCGGCMLVCPEKAVSEKDKTIGIVQQGQSKTVTVKTGILNAGEASGIPIIKNLLQNIKNTEQQLNIIDCPPGSSCIVMESIKDADYCILVAEPTIFGLHNLKMVYELVQLFSKPFGVVLNKCSKGKNPAEEFCIKENIAILGKISFDKMLGTENSNAHIIVRQNAQYNELFTSLLGKVCKEVQHVLLVNMV